MAATAPRLHNPAPRLTRFTCKTWERYGTKGDLAVKLTDTYHAFRGQLGAFTYKVAPESGADAAFDSSEELSNGMFGAVRINVNKVVFG
jgi:hypothetical protein